MKWLCEEPCGCKEKRQGCREKQLENKNVENKEARRKGKGSRSGSGEIMDGPKGGDGVMGRKESQIRSTESCSLCSEKEVALAAALCRAGGQHDVHSAWSSCRGSSADNLGKKIKASF